MGETWNRLAQKRPISCKADLPKDREMPLWRKQSFWILSQINHLQINECARKDGAAARHLRDCSWVQSNLDWLMNIQSVNFLYLQPTHITEEFQLFHACTALSRIWAVNVKEKKPYLWLPDRWVVPYWYPGCSWQPACSAYLPLNNYFLQVKCSLVFKSALCFTKITVHLFRQLSNLTIIPAMDAVLLLLHQRQRNDKRSLLVLFKPHIWAMIFILRITIRDWRTSASPVSEELKHNVVYIKKQKVKYLISTKWSLFYLWFLFLVKNDHQFRRSEMLIGFIQHAKTLLESKAALLLQLTTHKSVQLAAIPYWISLPDCCVCFQVRSGHFTLPGWEGSGQWTVSNPEEQSSLSQLLLPHKSKWSPVSTSLRHVSTV